MRALPVSATRCVHGSQSSIPRASTSPIQNSWPTSSLSRMPRVVMFRRLSPGASSIPARARASISSASIKVTSLPSPLSIRAPSRRALRSPVSPTPATASTEAAGCTGLLVTSAMWMCSIDPLNGSRLCMQPELVIVFGEVAGDLREVELAQDRSGPLALKQEVEASGDQVLDILLPAAPGPALEVSPGQAHLVERSLPRLLDRHLAYPASPARTGVHGDHTSSLCGGRAGG